MTIAKIVGASMGWDSLQEVKSTSWSDGNVSYLNWG